MAMSSYVQTAFLGGEISQSAQGRLDLPSYKVSMNVCLNSIPVESGAWMRRPGTRHVAPVRGGARGKLIPFTFAQNYPYVMEFTDGYLRFTTGPALVMTNDQQTVTAISDGNPAQITTALPHGWTSGNECAFNSLGVNNPLLQNRQFVVLVTGASIFQIFDALTGFGIDGATLGAFVSGNVTRILEIPTTTYSGGAWASLRSVQAEARSALLNGAHPQILQVATQPTTTQFATFTLGAADFIDGPYLDPVVGSQMSSSALSGVVTLTLSFQAYSSSVAYSVGDYVTQAGQGYRSLVSPNQNHTPNVSPTQWVAVNAGAPVNAGRGFVTSDVGRLVRLLSEPALWDASTVYTVGQIVSYPDGNGGTSYWIASGTVPTTLPPGASTLWALHPTAAIWTWAQITGVSGTGLLASVSPIGNMSSVGGLAAAFDGNTTKTSASAAMFTDNITTYPTWSAVEWAEGALVQYGGVGYRSLYHVYTAYPAAAYNPSESYSVGNIVQIGGFVYRAIAISSNFDPHPPGDPAYWIAFAAVSSAAPAGLTSVWAIALTTMPQPTERAYIGQHYTTPNAIQSAIFYPTTDLGILNSPNGGSIVTINLRAKATAPASAADGTLLGSYGPTVNLFSSVSITSNDQTTTWAYVWLEVVSTYLQALPSDPTTNIFVARIGTSQAQFFSPNISNGSVMTAQIRGPALLYAQTIRAWRLGVYSDTSGWPTCGTYHEGRIWLGGVVSNRFDAGVSNGFIGTQLDFTPTGPSGVVAGNNAISYTCTGEDVNQILWMTTDQQGILFGTKAGEWLISAPSQGAIAPTNIKAVRVTKIGCANIEPRRAEHTLLIVQKFARKIVEYFADVFSGKFSAPNLTERAKHLTVGGIAEIAYQQELVPSIWMRLTNGGLVGATYKRDTLTTSQGPNIIGHHRHTLGSGRVVESLCVGPSVNGNLDTVSMITNDLGTGVRHIEVMTDLLDEGFALTDCWFLDDAIVPSSTVVQPNDGVYGSLLVNGLSVHEGKTVTAYIAGLDCGDYVVTGGAITVPFGDGISGGSGGGLFTAALVASYATLPAVVGFTYTSDGQLVRPVTQADTGAQAGPGWAKLGRQHRVGAQLYGAVNGSISFGTDFVTLYPAKLRYANDVPYPINQQWSGIYRDQVNSLLDYDGMISWRISRPNPAFVMAVGGFMAKADA